MIRLDGVQKVYPNSERPAVDQVSLDIAGGEFLVLLGESGCGKTTLLKMINRLIDHTQGTIEVDGEDISQVDPVLLRRKVGYVFQGIGLFPHMTVGENIAIVPRLLHWETAKISQRIDELLEMVQLAPEQYRHRRPHELSGGQRQRVGVARALAARPKTVLMDEPFGALDPLNRDLLQMEYQQLHQRLEITTVMVTHDITEALILADRIAVMHSGHILQVGTPSELLNSPRHEYVENIMATPKRQADQLEALARGPRT